MDDIIKLSGDWGMGLSIVRAILEFHDGELLSFENNNNRTGCILKFRLPV